MKKDMKTIALLAFSLLWSACGNKNEEKASQDAVKDQIAQTQTTLEKESQPVEEQTPETSINESNADGSIIEKIRKEWRTKPIDVASGDHTVGITMLAFAFCGEYLDYKPNAALYEFLTQPQNYKEEKTGFHVNLEERNGYVSAHSMSQYNLNTDCCYWNRKNGHKLLGVWLDEEHEDWKKEAKLALFYDYDPKTDMLTPEPQLTDLVEKITASFNSYAVILPNKGKNIEITTFTMAEDDSFKSSSLTLVWDGQNFIKKK